MARIAVLSTLCGLVFLSSHCGQAHAKGFLARQEQVEGLLKAAEGMLGSELHHFAAKRLGMIENVLRPMYSAMQKNQGGKLGDAAASYALHRLFVQRHGWYVTGLEPAGKGFAAWRASSPTSVLRKHLPEHVVGQLKKRLFADGFGLHELAIVAATIEHFVRQEETERLLLAFETQHVSTKKPLQSGELDRVLDAYMTVYILGFVLQAQGRPPQPAQVRELLQHISDIYPTWPKTRDFVREVRDSVVPAGGAVSFGTAGTVVAEAGERYGRWQDTECRSMKAQLLALEDTGAGGAGRVRLADFYGLALHGKHFQFTESASYLRKLGALDESDPATPRVIIANYVYSPSNCVASSAYYQVCCINECEEMLSHFEQEVLAPEASPRDIGSIAASMPSPSAPKGRALSPWLLHQLEEVAKHHGGKVPLHGRLFAQWMHLAFPRECPYPHTSDAPVSVKLADLVGSERDIAEAVATEQEMRRWVGSAPPRSGRVLDAGAHEAVGMVSMHEELVV